MNAMSKPGGRPKLLRSMFTPEIAQEIGLERDPSAWRTGAVRHKGTLPASYVLKSKKDQPVPSVASEALRASINGRLQASSRNVEFVDAQRAAELLKAAQSDSDDDF